MAESNVTPNVAIPLPKAKKNMVMIGCICMMLSVAMFGLSLATIQGPILESMGAMEYFSLLTIFASLGLSIMTPIGGKLGDLLGRRNIVIYAGLVAAICGLGLGLVKSFVPFAILRLLLGAGQGAFTAAPYILAREINEPKDVPRAMGMLASAIAIGGFGGSIIAGALTDAGYLRAAIMFPAIPLLLGVLLIGLNLPNVKRDNIKIDVPGIICLVVTLGALLLSLNFGSRVGWTNPIILVGFVVAIVAGVVMVKVENKAAEPILPMRLFRNRNFTVLLLVGFICYFYNNAMTAYAPLAMQQVLGASVTASGALQMPRTIITMILPTVLGVWVGKKKSRNWIAMACASGIVVLAFLSLSFVTAATSVILFFVAIGATGIAEGFRSVSITPAAQMQLERQDIGVGTSLVTFFNSLSSLIAAAVSGVVFDLHAGDVQAGWNSVAMTTTIVTLVGLLVVLLVVRPHFKDEK
jgi:MFS family permease